MSTAVVVEQTGGPDVLQVIDREPPEPGPGEVAVDVAAAGVNFIDTYFRTGLYPRPLPFVNGMEGAGTVEAVGDGVTELAEGDRVAWSAVPGVEHAPAAASTRTERLPRRPTGGNRENP